MARYAATTAGLVVLVAGIAGGLGAIAAWLVALHRFPGRGLFSWALALPLAAPAFAVAYGYADLLDVAGPVQTVLRARFGFDLPLRLRSLWGAAFVLGLAFYPYTYLTLRAALESQAAQAVEAARTLGAGPWRAFSAVALPMAWPAVAAGLSLTVMETLADYGAVKFLSVQTLTTGVVRAWSVYGSPGAAARFALPLLGAAALLIWIERTTRGRRQFAAAGGQRPFQPIRLTGAAAFGASLFCTLLLVLALLLPAAWLAISALQIEPQWSRLIPAAVRTVTLGTAGAVATVGLAVLLALTLPRLGPVARSVSLGYATPGAVMAIGLLAPAAVVWSLVPGAAAGFGWGLALLIYAYAARLAAAALEPVAAGPDRAGPAMVGAARLLGRSEAGAAFGVRLPVARGAVFTALLIVFVDVLKELPATLILRPFDFDTLAVLASNYAQDERLAQAGPPSLMIILLALPGVVWLSRRMADPRRESST
ncbi:MAG: iron ABC transporter permease [Caulobacter sp.]|nr:iron ABC transporter permease [Caulobacter sp.]